MRLKVGDVELDSESGVSFDGSAGPTPAKREREIARPHEIVVDAPPRAFWILGGASFGLATVVALLATVFQIWWLGLPALFGLFITVAAVAMGHRTAGRGQSGEVSGAHIDRVSVLVDRHEGIGVAELVRRSGLSEQDVARSLVELIERGEVEEDLDLDTGAWAYRKTTVLSGLQRRETLSAADRLTAIQEHQTEGSKR